MLTELRGKNSLSSKRIGLLEELLDKEIVKGCVMEVLNLTKYQVPQSEILSKSELIVEDIRQV